MALALPGMPTSGTANSAVLQNCEKMLCINVLGDILAVESGYEQGCKRGAKS